VTSLADLGLTATMMDVDLALRTAFEAVFGTTVDEPEPASAQPGHASV
jgi:lipoyl(octanoyl) transferase